MHPLRPHDLYPLLTASHDRSLATDLRRLEQAGVIRRLTRHVFLPKDEAESPRLRALAVHLELAELAITESTRERLVLAMTTAAWVHTGVALFDAATAAYEPQHWEVVIAPRGHRPGDTRIVTHEYVLEPTMVTSFGDITVTTADRTAADLARTLSTTDVGLALDALSREAGVTAASVLAMLNRMTRQRGVAVARRRVKAWDRARRDGAAAISD